MPIAGDSRFLSQVSQVSQVSHLTRVGHLGQFGTLSRSWIKLCDNRNHSHGLRLTVIKFGEYWRFLLFGFLFDLLGVIFPWYGYPYMTIVITIGLAVIEFKSLLEHAKKRKSKTAELPDIIKDIVECATTEDAQKLVKSIRDIYDETKK